MIIENIPSKIAKIKKSSRDELKLFLVFSFMAAALGFASGFLFFYIEHCYDPQPVVLTASELKYEQLCIELRKQLQPPLAQNSSTNNGTSMRFTNDSNINNYTKNNNKSHTFTTTPDLVNRFCKPAKPNRNNCKLDTGNMALWASYSSSISYTFGFGHVVCRSVLGKIVSMIYALISIPLTTSSLYLTSKQVNYLIQYIVLSVENRMLHRKQVARFTRKVVFFQLLILAISFGVQCYLDRSFIIGPDGKPDYDPFNNFYFHFIMTTTIGFGDYNYDYKKFFSEDSGAKKTMRIISTSYNLYLTLTMVASLINTLVESFNACSHDKKKITKDSMDEKVSDNDKISHGNDVQYGVENRNYISDPSNEEYLKT